MKTAVIFAILAAVVAAGDYGEAPPAPVEKPKPAGPSYGGASPEPPKPAPEPPKPNKPEGDGDYGKPPSPEEVTPPEPVVETKIVTKTKTEDVVETKTEEVCVTVSETEVVNATEVEEVTVVVTEEVHCTEHYKVPEICEVPVTVVIEVPEVTHVPGVCETDHATLPAPTCEMPAAKPTNSVIGDHVPPMETEDCDEDHPEYPDVDDEDCEDDVHVTTVDDTPVVPTEDYSKPAKPAPAKPAPAPAKPAKPEGNPQQEVVDKVVPPTEPKEQPSTYQKELPY